LKKIRPILIVLLIIGTICLSLLIYQSKRKKREIKEDLIELSNIKYGLFNVDEWKNIATTIITKKIEEFELKGDNAGKR